MLEFSHPSLDSTSAQARRLLVVHGRQRLLVHARTQTDGRGRSGRRWCSPVGGAWMSIAWPIAREPTSYTPLPLVVGLAVYEAVQPYADSRDLRIKWPNDLLLDDRKVAGILCEHVHDHRAIIIGVGVNANDVHLRIDADAHLPAASLGPLDVEPFIADCAGRIETRVEAFEHDGLGQSAIDAINASLAWRGQTVSIGTVTGACLGIDPRGALRVDAAGVEHTFDAGELTLRKA